MVAMSCSCCEAPQRQQRALALLYAIRRIIPVLQASGKAQHKGFSNVQQLATLPPKNRTALGRESDDRMQDTAMQP